MITLRLHAHNSYSYSYFYSYSYSSFFLCFYLCVFAFGPIVIVYTENPFDIQALYLFSLNFQVFLFIWFKYSCTSCLALSHFYPKMLFFNKCPNNGLTQTPFIRKTKLKYKSNIQINTWIWLFLSYFFHFFFFLLLQFCHL